MSFIPRVLVFTVACCAAVAWAQTTAPLKPVDAGWSQKKEEQIVRQIVEGLPSLGKRDARDVLRFSVENGYLVLTSPLADVSRAHTVDVDGVPGISTLELIVVDSGQPIRFPQFKNWLNEPTLTHLIDISSAMAGHVQVVYATEGPLGSRQVGLLQSPMVEEKGAVRLRVQTTNELLPQSTGGNVDVSAPTWSAFVRTHPREASVYLRPTFRKLRAEQDVFAVDPNEAWQVLARHWTEPPGLRGKIIALLPRLDADDFRDRRAAAKELQQLGQPAAMILNTLDRKTLSPEQVSRIDAIEKAVLPLAPDEAPKLASDRDYLVNLLYNDDPALTSAVLKRLGELSSGPKKFDPAARGDARLRAVDALWTTELQPATRPTHP